MRFRLGGRGLVGLVFVVLTGSLLLAAPAFASVPCSGVQASLNSSSTGSLIVLDAGSTCTTGLPWQLPSHRVTIDGNGAIVDAGGAGRIFTGTDIAATTIKNFTLKNGAAANGGAISLTGSSIPTLSGMHFLNNEATGNGGALYASITGKITVESSTFGDGTADNKNQAANGGGAYFDAPAVSVTGSTFDTNSATASGGALSTVNTTGVGVSVGLTSNTLRGNTAGSTGGGAALNVVSGFGVIVDNTVQDNHITPSPSSKLARGAGMTLIGSSSGIQQAFMTNNRFSANSVDNTGDPTEFSAEGGGLWLSALSVSSTNDVFKNNDLAAPGSGGNDSSRGAGLAIDNCADGALVELVDGVFAGNSTPAGAEGAGVDANCPGGALQLKLLNSTISGNTAGGGSAGLAGGSDDTLVAGNSVLVGNSGGEDDLDWAGSSSITYSVACDPANPGTPQAGAGNICATPQFLDATNGDVRQLIGSPTLDAGDNGLVPFGLTTDFEGDPRIAATRSPTKRVDMGADERGAIPCAFLAGDLATAPSGTVITLRQGEVCVGNFTLPSLPIGLTAEGTGATIDGNHTGSALAGTDVGATSLSNLTILNGQTAADGGGVSVSGASAPSLANMLFRGNSADGAGGALSVSGPTAGTVTLDNVTFGDGTPASANSAAQGGAVAIDGGADVVVTNSRFLRNAAQTDGGGAWFSLSGGAAATLTSNTFDSNTLAAGLAAQANGGGLAIAGGGGPATLKSNVFKGNSISGGSPGGFSPRGGGAYIAGMGISGNSDRFIQNVLAGSSGSGAAQGGGLAVDCGGSNQTTVLQNAVFAGNTAQGTQGGGVAFGCAGPGSFSLRNSTVAGNSVTSNTGGVWGSPTAGLILVNSIVADNGGDQLNGFATRSVTFTDICSGGSPFAGTGNLCVPPLLANAAGGDVHEPLLGPTVDKGSNAANIGLLTDFEGSLRLTDGNRDGIPTIDMGADETATFPVAGALTPEEEAALAALAQQAVLGAKSGAKAYTIPKKVKALRLVKVKQKKGVLSLYFKTTKAGTLESLTTFAKPKKKKSAKSAKALKPAKGQQAFGRAKKKLKKKGSFILKVKPSRSAKAALKKKFKIRVKIVGRLTPGKGKGKAVSVKKAYTVKVKKPKKKKS